MMKKMSNFKKNLYEAKKEKVIDLAVEYIKAEENSPKKKMYYIKGMKEAILVTALQKLNFDK